ncbi:FG-GAP repeat domain-containing protein [Rheinheimera sp. NSM]|uniref:FG-GAP repeat domain-containing protein n=1 Tax=Rheinheimera sp. NSM TaxID=3457884 RepID=UPI0040367A6B
MKTIKFLVLALALAFGFFATTYPVAKTSKSLPLTLRPLPPATTPLQKERLVNPSVKHIASWISAAGASAALGDLDGDGLMNNLCLVDPRSDTVSIGTVSSDPSKPAHSVHGFLRPPGAADAIAPMGCRIVDLNSDGWSDVLVYYWGRAPALFVNRGNWSFSASDILDTQKQAYDWYTNTVHIADFNGDGLLDIFVGNYFPDGSELLDTKSRRRVSMHSSFSRAFNGGMNRILLQKPGEPGNFEMALDIFAPDYGQGWTLASASADLTGDLLPELFVANDFGPDQIFLNRSGNGKLQLEPRKARSKKFGEPLSHGLGRDSFKGMGVSIDDLNNDGFLDIVVSNITQRWGLFETQMLFLNSGSEDDPLEFYNASEELATARTAFSWDNKIADLDNDGIPEILQATGFVRGKIDRWPEIQEIALANDALVPNAENWPNLVGGDISGEAPRVVLSRADTKSPFQNVAEASGLDDAGISRGIALADIDGDGDLDWVEANHFADSRLVVNECAPCGAYVGLRLLRVREQDLPIKLDGLKPAHSVGGSTAIGATVSLESPSGDRKIAFVNGGNGHSGQQSTDIHLGLAEKTTSPLIVTITWRDFEGNVRSTTIEVNQKWQTILLPS